MSQDTQTTNNNYIPQTISAVKRRTEQALSPWVQERLQRKTDKQPLQQRMARTGRSTLTLGSTLSLVNRVQRTVDRTKVWKPNAGTVTPRMVRRFTQSIVARHQPLKPIGHKPSVQRAEFETDQVDMVLPGGAAATASGSDMGPGQAIPRISRDIFSASAGQRIEPMRPASVPPVPSQRPSGRSRPASRSTTRPQPKKLPPQSRLFSRVEEVRGRGKTSPAPGASPPPAPPVQRQAQAPESDETPPVESQPLEESSPVTQDRTPSSPPARPTVVRRKPKADLPPTPPSPKKAASAGQKPARQQPTPASPSRERPVSSLPAEPEPQPELPPVQRQEDEVERPEVESKPVEDAESGSTSPPPREDMPLRATPGQAEKKETDSAPAEPLKAKTVDSTPARQPRTGRQPEPSKPAAKPSAPVQRKEKPAAPARSEPGPPSKRDRPARAADVDDRPAQAADIEPVKPEPDIQDTPDGPDFVPVQPAEEPGQEPAEGTPLPVQREELPDMPLREQARPPQIEAPVVPPPEAKAAEPPLAKPARPVIEPEEQPVDRPQPPGEIDLPLRQPQKPAGSKPAAPKPVEKSTAPEPSQAAPVQRKADKPAPPRPAPSQPDRTAPAPETLAREARPPAVLDKAGPEPPQPARPGVVKTEYITPALGKATVTEMPLAAKVHKRLPLRKPAPKVMPLRVMPSPVARPGVLSRPLAAMRKAVAERHQSASVTVLPAHSVQREDGPQIEETSMPFLTGLAGEVRPQISPLPSLPAEARPDLVLPRLPQSASPSERKPAKTAKTKAPTIGQPRLKFIKPAPAAPAPAVQRMADTVTPAPESTIQRIEEERSETEEEKTIKMAELAQRVYPFVKRLFALERERGGNW